MSTKPKDELDDLLDRIQGMPSDEKVYEVVTKFSKPEIKKRLSENNENRMVDVHGREIIYVILKEKKKEGKKDLKDIKKRVIEH